MKQNFLNPVFETDFADIGVLKTAEGFHAYASQGVVGDKLHNLQHAFSRNMVDWTREPDALPEKASWAPDQDYWAPDPVKLSDTEFRLFFNAKVKGSGQGIGVAVSASPYGFKATEAPLVQGRDYINIDAKTFQNPVNGQWFLLWGSCYEPIKIQELNNDLLGFRYPKEQPIDLLHTEPQDPLRKLYEAACMTSHFDPVDQKLYFYLYTSGPDAFGDEGYTVQVARSSEGPTTGFVTMAEATGKPDSVIYRSNARFVNPGASVIVADDADQDWLVSHATLMTDVPNYHVLRQDPQKLWDTLRYTRRVMILDKLDYVNGWPCVADGSPSVLRQAGPVIRTVPGLER